MRKRYGEDGDSVHLDDESFKFRALSAGAVMAFDGQTELDSLPSKSTQVNLD